MIDKFLRFLGYVSIGEIDRRHRVFLEQQRRKQSQAQDQETKIKAAHWIEAGCSIWSDIVLESKFEENKNKSK